KDAQAHTSLGVALAGKGQLDEAIACFRKALALDPKDAQAHTNLGNALRRKGDLDGAIACYRTAIALDPKHATAHHNLGKALAQKGRVDEAIACYKKAIELDPKYAGADLALLRDLDAVDQFRWTWLENRFPDPAVVATRTRAALKRFGADPDATS